MEQPKEITYGHADTTARTGQEEKAASDALQFNAGALSEKTLKEPSIGNPNLTIKNYTPKKGKDGSC